MRSILGVFMGVTILLVIFSCATTQPLGEGELRLLRMQVPENGNLRLGHAYKFNFNFESNGSPDIIRAVCTCIGGVQVYRPEGISYGSQGRFVLWLYACDYDSHRLECYVDYVSEGKRRRSNSVYGLVYGMNP